MTLETNFELKMCTAYNWDATRKTNTTPSIETERLHTAQRIGYLRIEGAESSNNRPQCSLTQEHI